MKDFLYRWWLAYRVMWTCRQFTAWPGLVTRDALARLWGDIIDVVLSLASLCLMPFAAGYYFLILKPLVRPFRLARTKTERQLLQMREEFLKKNQFACWACGGRRHTRKCGVRTCACCGAGEGGQ